MDETTHTLRQHFLVEELRDAAECNDAERLSVVRQLIREIKLIQLEEVSVASDDMVIKAIDRLVKLKKMEYDVIAQYAQYSQAYLQNNK